jgi:thioredoxin-dependent peroxiredoxin
MEGKKAPAFTLFDQDENKVTLKDLAGQWTIIYFYPKDDTSGCTIEAKEFTDLLVNFKKLNCEVIGVSPDTVEKHCKFIAKHKLKVRLLADPEKKMLEKYGVWQEKSMYGRKYMGVVRGTVLLNPKGKVVKHWPKVKAAGHAQAVLDLLKELQ